MTTFLFFYNVLTTFGYAGCTVAFVLIYRRSKKTIYKYASLLMMTGIVDDFGYFLNEFLPSFPQFYEGVFHLSIIITTVVAIVWLMLLADTILLTYQNMISGYWHAIWCLICILSFFFPVMIVVAVALTLVVSVNALFKKDRCSLPPSLLGLSSLTLGFNLIRMVLFILFYKGAYWSVEFAEAIYARDLSIELCNLFVLVTALFYIWKYASELQGDMALVRERREHFEEVCNSCKLTKQEKAVTKLALEGYNNKEIGEQLFISEGTVKAHLHNAYAKLEVKTRVELLVKFKNG